MEHVCERVTIAFGFTSDWNLNNLLSKNAKPKPMEITFDPQVKTVRWDNPMTFFVFTTDVDECSAESSPCDKNADCTNGDGSYTCTCKQGFIGDGASCTGLSEYSNNSFYYACFAKKTLRWNWDNPTIYHFTKTDVDECSTDPRPCDENADCTNSDGSYSCTCKQGFTGNGSLCQGMKE